METTLQRLKQFIDFKDFNISSFERLVGFSNGSLASQIKNNKTVGVDKLEKILKIFPDLSSDWLLTGTGQMIKNYELHNNATQTEKTKFTRYQNISKALTGTLTARQRWVSEDNYSKLVEQIRNMDGDYKDLLTSIERFENFRDFSDEFSELYLSKFFSILFATDLYLNSNKFNYSEYKRDVVIEFEKLKGMRLPLIKLIEAIDNFYSDFKQYDTKNILENPEVPK